ncbi:HEAT repeat domain-containing protein [Catellatospora sp. KI3]|uniref:HEAT repeat domain-containing protein n=1 Tax=Catellatospora sp. KI3 TaxID=3041620 RepID=UPI002482234B|nr:HEAT repeat domain-containing protein [Catellatospora sp. KI3]MDI1464629.1 HEAT repeat domain-containing protein [Catellatospora sp. KI3]
MSELADDPVRLFSAAVHAYHAEPYDDDAFRDPLLRLARGGAGPAVDLARTRLRDDDTAVRAGAARLLRVLDEVGGDTGREEVAALLVDLIGEEKEPDVLCAMIEALGGSGRPHALPVLVGLAGHPDGDVRHQVAAALPAVLAGAGLPADGVAVLIRLSADSEPHVRDWATYGLGTALDADTEAIRAALWARTGDSYVPAFEEGVHGLARRKDPGAVALVAALLADDGASELTFSSAAALGDPSLVPLLAAYDQSDPLVVAALAACAEPE